MRARVGVILYVHRAAMAAPRVVAEGDDTSPLKDIRVADELQFIAGGGATLRYRVRQTLIIGPDDVWVLDITPQPTLTLITC